MFREQRPHQKRMLAVDGGGILGVTSLYILKKIEDELKKRVDEPNDFRLCHFFDYFGGTSTGAIICAGLAVGMKVDDILELYKGAGKNIFVRSDLWNRLRYQYDAKPLAKKLREKLSDLSIEDLNDSGFKGDGRLQSLLMVVTRNAVTRSFWPISTNPEAKFYGVNKRIKLWQLVRASTAAPFYFPPEVIKVDDQNKFTFEDGGVTAYNNPAYQLYRMATAPYYRLGWPSGEDKLMLVSVGAGQALEVMLKRNRRGGLLWSTAMRVPSDLMDGISVEHDISCREVGRCVYGANIDTEIDDLVPRDDSGAVLPLDVDLGRKFLYARYSADLSKDGLASMGLGHIDPEDMTLDNVDMIPELIKIGERAAEQVKFAQHFSSFVE